MLAQSKDCRIVPIPSDDWVARVEWRYAPANANASSEVTPTKSRGTRACAPGAHARTTLSAVTTAARWRSAIPGEDRQALSEALSRPPPTGHRNSGYPYSVTERVTRRWGLLCLMVLIAGIAASPADARQSRKKAIWGPLEKNGVS